MRIREGSDLGTNRTRPNVLCYPSATRDVCHMNLRENAGSEAIVADGV